MAFFVKFGYLEPELKPEDMRPVNDHFVKWLRDLHATGRFVMSGGFETLSFGMTLLEADNKETAMKIFADDPFNKLLTSWDIHEWKVVGTEKE